MCSTNEDFESGLWSIHLNKAPGALPQMARYASSAVTGHNSSWVSLTPFMNGSVLDLLSWMEMTNGEVALSTATSEKDRWILRSYLEANSTVISPDPVVVVAAHSMVLLEEGRPPIQICQSLQRIEGAIGRQAWGYLPAWATWTLMPLRTCLRQGIWSMWGSWKPAATRSWQIPDRYAQWQNKQGLPDQYKPQSSIECVCHWERG